jgi:hypothetical protein
LALHNKKPFYHLPFRTTAETLCQIAADPIRMTVKVMHN